MPTDLRQVCEYAREMRQNPTDSERRFFYQLCNFYGFPAPNHETRKIIVFQKVFNIRGYPMITDFFIRRHSLVFEIDGSIHNTDAKKSQDIAKDQRLKSIGVLCVRVPNWQTHTDCTGLIRDSIRKSTYKPQTIAEYYKKFEDIKKNTLGTDSRSSFNPATPDLRSRQDGRIKRSLRLSG